MALRTSPPFPFLFVMAAGLLAACQRESRLEDRPEVVPGKTTTAELITQLGAPSQARPLESRPGAESLDYPGGEHFQAEGGKIVAHWRDPSEKESTLQYWRHKWKGKNPVYEPLEGTRDPHGNSQYILRETAGKMGVVYDPGKDRVIRVIRYGN